MKKNTLDTKNIENIGNVSIKDLTISEGNIGIYMPINNASEAVQAQLDKLEGWFRESFAKKHPDIDTSNFTLCIDNSLFMDLSTENFTSGQQTKVKYSISTIMWFEEAQNTDFEEVEFYDPYEIDINEEDSRFIKKLVMHKLLDLFF